MGFDIKKVLFPTDLSDNSRWAFGHAAGIADQYGASIVIFHVAEGLTEKFKKRITSYMGQAAWDKIKSDQEKDVRGLLIGKKTERQILGQAIRKMTESLYANGELSPFETDEIVVGEGNVTEAVLETTREKNCDLIVMAAQGELLLATAGLGRTTKNILKRAPVPVLIVPPPVK